MRMNLRHAAQAMGASCGQGIPDVVVTGISFDSRKTCSGDLFFCLSGARTDGHDHAGQALERGAAAIVATRDLADRTGQALVLRVKDAEQALGLLAHAWRDASHARVVGISGSAGKTTVKEMLAQVCALTGKTCRNHMNWNNQIGLPASMLACEGNEAFWVLEAGISRPGDMDVLGRILAPDVVVLVNAGAAHLAGLGGTAQVAAAKADLLHHLRPDGRGVVNQDCALLWEASQKRGADLVGFSLRNPAADVYSPGLYNMGNGISGMQIDLRGQPLVLSWPERQTPHPENVLACAAAGMVLGLNSEVIRQGLAMPVQVPGRFTVHDAGAWTLVDDTYNANPLSMAAALHRVHALAGERPLVCVLGDMLELGEQAGEAHRDLGQKLAEAGCRAVLYCGEFGQEVRAGLNAGLNVGSKADDKGTHGPGHFAAFAGSAQFLELWKRLPLDQGIVLFKGSRGGAMEQYLETLRRELRS